MKDENAMKGYCYVHALVTVDDVYSYDDVYPYDVHGGI